MGNEAMDSSRTGRAWSPRARPGQRRVDDEKPGRAWSPGAQWALRSLHDFIHARTRLFFGRAAGVDSIFSVRGLVVVIVSR